MIRGLEIFDTWLMMTAASLFLWAGMTGLYTGSGGVDAVVDLLGGIAGCSFAALLCRESARRSVLLTLRLVMIACLAYLTWFQERPWLALDDSALVRGSFRQEFLLQRLEQVGTFLLFVLPLLALGVWHGKMLPRPADRQPHLRVNLPRLAGLVALSVGAAVAARLVGVPRLGPISWGAGAIAFAALVTELARWVSKAEFPAFIAFAVVVVAMPVVLLWP